MKTELILEIIHQRWSPYAFSSQPIEEFRLKAMFQAAGCAPSSRNEQPWIFVYTTREEMEVFETFLGFMNESNSIWAKNAYALAISMARTTNSYNNTPNRFAMYDTGMAVSNLLLQAYSMDILVHQIGGFSVEKVKSYFKLDSDTEPIAMMVIGYSGDGASLPPDLQKRDEERRPRNDVNLYTFRNKPGNPGF